MKKYLMKISALVLLLSLTFGCSEELLDIPQKSVLTFDYYTNAGPAEAEALGANLYNRYYASVTTVIHNMFLDILSDDHFAGGGSFTDAASDFQFAGLLITTPSHTNVRGFYQNAYQLIYRANNIIEKIPETTDARINRVKAEAKFFRALMMFELVRWFGTPPFVDHVVVDESEYYPSNGDPAQIIPWCLEQMQEVADALPAISGIGQQKAFGARVSKHAALAYKGKIALWYGTKYKDNTILAQAVEPLKTVINSGLYGLLDDISMIDRPAADFSKEYIFEKNHEDNGLYSSSQADLRNQYVNWRIEHMAIPDNVAPIGWGWAPPTGDFGDFLKNHEGGIEKPRFKSTILTWEQVLALPYTNSAYPPGLHRVPLDHCQGYFRYRRMLFTDDLYTFTSGAKFSMANTHYMRYAEVLLMYAEAKFLVDNDADGTGLNALNEVRRRAQIPTLASMTYQDIKDERRAEMWGQAERYFDLVRWGDAATVLKDKGKVLYSFYGYKPGTTEYDIRTTPGGPGWTDKFNTLPFPSTQLGANPNLKQDPRWE
jgi:hypothetical protein